MCVIEWRISENSKTLPWIKLLFFNLSISRGWKTTSLCWLPLPHGKCQKKVPKNEIAS